MKNFLLSLFVFCALSGCTVFKHTEKTTTDVKTSEKQHVTTVTDETVTETTNTNVYVPPDSAKGSKPLATVLKDSGMTVTDGNLTGTLSIDKKGNVNLNVSSKPRTIPVQGTKVTARHTITDADEEKKTDAKTTEKKIEVERKWFSWSWLWWLLVPAIVFGAYKAYQIFKPKL